MATVREHPKRGKKCVFCHYWTGNANMKFISTTVGYEYELTAEGKCMKNNYNKKTHSSCSYFKPSIEAAKLL